MTTINFSEYLEEAKKASVELSVYRWTEPKQYRRGIHTDRIDYICGTLTGMEDVRGRITNACLMDVEELNATVYANTSELATESEYIVIIEDIEEEE